MLLALFVFEPVWAYGLLLWAASLRRFAIDFGMIVVFLLALDAVSDEFEGVRVSVSKNVKPYR